MTQRAGLFGSRPPQPSTEAHIDLSRALDHLSPEQRAAIVLHYYQDMSVEETARALKTPVDTMKSRLKAALRRLRELTGAEEDSHE